MTKIFSNSFSNADVWDMQGAIIQFGSSFTGTQSDAFDSNTVIAIGLQLGYGRQIQKRYPINVKRAIFMLGTPQGTLNMTLLFGPNKALNTFLTMFGASGDESTDAQNMLNGTNNIYIKPFGKVIASSGNSTTTGQLNTGTWKVINPIIGSIGLSISETGTASIPAVGTVSMEFTELEIE